MKEDREIRGEKTERSGEWRCAERYENGPMRERAREKRREIEKPARKGRGRVAVGWREAKGSTHTQSIVSLSNT